jgi:putative transposase
MAKVTRNTARPQPRIVSTDDDESAARGPDDGRGEIEILGPDPLGERLRGIIGKLIEELVNEEIEGVLHARRYERAGEGEQLRVGYRHGGRERELTTSLGAAEIRVPRARLFGEDGEASIEWKSQLLPRYKRRTRDVDDAVLGAYLSGANTRKIRGALQPMLKGAPLSKSAVSRVIQNLKVAFDEWRTQSLEGKRIMFLYLDAIHVKVRCGGRVESMPVLVALGVHESGEKEVLGLRLAASESRNAWGTMVDDLAARGLQAPLLCTIDGSQGLRSAVRSAWPSAKVQRCVVHKLRNLEAHCPKKLLDELRSDFHAVSEATSEKVAKKAYERFIRLWKPRCEGVVESFVEAGEELLTHYAFPKSQWKCLRTTNSIERVNEEFRRRIKTQSSLPSESSVLVLFFGVIESGQVRMRRIDGWKDIAKAVIQHGAAQVANAQDSLLKAG